MAVEIARWQFTVADYARMRETGILSEDDRVELIDGEVRPMSPIGPLHAAIVNRLNRLIGRLVGESAIVSVQNPIQLNDYSEPQPDIVVLRPRDDFYAETHPRAGDIHLVVEVADTSIDYDREEKLPRYAEAGIAEVWLIAVDNHTVEQYTQPRNGRYHTIQLIEAGEVVQTATLPNLSLAVDDILGM